MNTEFQYCLTTDEIDLLRSTASQTVVRAYCIGQSIQNAVPESGVLCQAVVIQTPQAMLVIRPTSQDFGDVEVFRLSVVHANDEHVSSHYQNLKIMPIEKDFGTLATWRAIELSAVFERENGDVLRTQVDGALLLQFGCEERLLLKISGLPFFMHCFVDSSEIDAELSKHAGR